MDQSGPESCGCCRGGCLDSHVHTPGRIKEEIAAGDCKRSFICHTPFSHRSAEGEMVADQTGHSDFHCHTPSCSCHLSHADGSGEMMHQTCTDRPCYERPAPVSHRDPCAVLLPKPNTCREYCADLQANPCNERSLEVEVPCRDVPCWDQNKPIPKKDPCAILLQKPNPCREQCAQPATSCREHHSEGQTRAPHPCREQCAQPASSCREHHSEGQTRAPHPCRERPSESQSMAPHPCRERISEAHHHAPHPCRERISEAHHHAPHPCRERASDAHHTHPDPCRSRPSNDPQTDNLRCKIPILSLTTDEFISSREPQPHYICEEKALNPNHSPLEPIEPTEPCVEKPTINNATTRIRNVYCTSPQYEELVPVPPDKPVYTGRPTHLNHLTFKDKQLVLSALRKISSNMNSLKLLQDRHRESNGCIGKRDFQIVMDKSGLLKILSSREVDAVFRGFPGGSESFLDYEQFVVACEEIKCIQPMTVGKIN